MTRAGYKVYLAAFFSGALFSLGLGISGMTEPGNIVGYLDVFGQWNPRLLIVMASALPVYMLANTLRGRLAPRPVLALDYLLPTRRPIDGRLLVGAGVFGLGWGVAGFCPGPALTSLVSGEPGVVMFVAGMAGGMVLFRVIAQGRARQRAQARAPALEEG